MSDATAALPPLVRAHLQGVEVAIGDVPDDGSDRRFSRYETGLAGDRLTLYRRPLELRAYSRNDLVELIRETLTRQVADHLGLDEDGIDEW